ncbi:hypothetical protein FJT64_010006 [Amphibalanus amphitrite]|uniref:Protein SON n=1 Tax=Amphibalanus amphitrite TaxID=1232801 RepID=A0A6A4VDI7_AMPAM|nr:hypothetical protein FJT64_010006 [Amphibalanus amphitrite]
MATCSFCLPIPALGLAYVAFLPHPISRGPGSGQLAAARRVSENSLSLSAAAEPAGRQARRGATIVIRSLKHSAVFEQAEEEARRREAERQARYEDGEISDSSSDAAGPAETPAGKADAEEDPVDKTEHSNADDGEISSDENEVSGKKNDKTDEDGKKKSKKAHKKGRDRSSSRHKRRRRSGSSSRTRDRDSERDGERDRSPRDSGRHGHRERHRSSRRRRSSRSASRERHRSRERSSRRDRDWDQHDHRDRDRGDRRDRDRGDLRERIDKRRLLEVARRNALRLGEEGLLPAGLEAALPDPRRATAKNLHQLTEMCRRLRDEESDGGGRTGGRRASDDEAPFHHPFAVKERPSHIVMNIRNAPQLPVKTHAERQATVAKLSSSFPVSSGEQHRTKELEWVPVEPENKTKSSSTAPKAIEAPPAATEPATTTAAAPTPVPAPVPPPVTTPAAAPAPADSVFPTPPPPPEVDLNTIVSRRLTAIRELQQNPHSRQAQHLMDSAHQDMQNWAASQQRPGVFHGSTGARVLSAAELSTGQQAWAKKNQLKTSAPVTGGVGELLLKKMGWRPGQGLGKNQDGSLTPLLLDVKMDKKGLVSEDERPGAKRQAPVTMTTVKDLSGKHPISALMELCTKRRWGPPDFQLCMDRGPAHNKHFLYKAPLQPAALMTSLDGPTNSTLISRRSALASRLMSLAPEALTWGLARPVCVPPP